MFCFCNYSLILAVVVQVLLIFLSKTDLLKLVFLNRYLLSMSKLHQIDSLLFMSNFDEPAYFRTIAHTAYSKINTANYD